jgi:hypothetical protein
MSLQGPIIVVTENPAAELTGALSAAGAFPVVESKWADAPTAFVAVKPAAVVIAEPGQSRNDSAVRMLGLQIATANGAMVPVIERVNDAREAAIPIALVIDAALPDARLVARLQWAMRVRAVHATVLRRIELYASRDGMLPPMPAGDALDDATVLVAGRGPLYPALSVAIGERVSMLGGLSVEIAARHLSRRDIDGIVVGDGFSPRMVEAFLTLLAQDNRYRAIPVAVIAEAPADLADALTNIIQVDGEPARLLARMIPLVRLHAFQARLKRMLKTLETEGLFDPQTGLMTRESFIRDLTRAIVEAGDRSQPLSVTRLTFDGPLDERASLDCARQVTRLVRNIDFAMREDDGAILVAFTQTDLRSAHVAVRRIAGALKAVLAPRYPRREVAANITPATLKAGDTLDSLIRRIDDSQTVAAE